jgi:hypothetical protein
LQSVVPASLADRVREAAKEESRTTSNWIRVELERRLRDERRS